MQEKYYTVEAISQMLKMHPKTIQRYIREGKIPATKVGKAWRVSGHSLSVFVGNEDIFPAKDTSKQLSDDKIMISSVVDIDVANIDEAMQIVNMLTASLNSKTPEYGKSSMQTQYIDLEHRVRIMLYGNIKFMEAMIYFISNYVKK